jgi:hypothetical protein
MRLTKNAEISSVFRRFPQKQVRPKRPHSKAPCPPLLPRRTERQKCLDNQRKHHWALFLSGYFYINLPSTLERPTLLIIHA